jgi:hypothetical protein
MTMYKLQKNRNGDDVAVGIVGTGWSIPFNPELPQYQAYLKWLESGNQPLPADEPQA